MTATLSDNKALHGRAASILEKIDRSISLDMDDGVWLYEDCDPHTLGILANRARERRHGRAAYYNVNRHINYSNYCVLRCKFCSFYRPYPKERRDPPTKTVHVSQSGGLPVLQGALDEAYELSVEEVVARSVEAVSAGATEVHIVGGLHPKLPFSYYTDLCSSIRQACPSLHIKAFTAIEIIHFARIAKPRLTVREVLSALVEAGLNSMPGGGAEIFDERVHDEVFQNKVGEVEWFQVHREAHELGIFTNATMLYGHVESPQERLTHLLKLREHQAESLRSRKAHFNCLVPLPFIPGGSALTDLAGPSALDNLRTLAVSRLLLDNVAHIKAFWIMQSPQLAQVSLNWGVDDIDGTVVYYDITKRENQGTHQELTVEKLRRMICEAGCVPIERDSLYRRVLRDNGAWRVDDQEIVASGPAAR